MDFKKIRKSEISLFATVLGILVAIGIFFALYGWWNYNVSNAGLTMNSEYSNTYKNLSEQQTRIDNNIDAIKSNLTAATEAREGIFTAAINGFKGLGNALKLPIIMADSARATVDIFATSGNGVIPPWVKVIFIIGITALVIFIIAAIMSGASNKWTG